MRDIERRKPLSDQIWFGAFVVVPFLALIVGLVPAWGYGVDLVSLPLGLAFFFVRMFGITTFFHRGTAHQSFVVTRPWVTYAAGIAGSMAVQGSLFLWVGQHILHHQHPDEEGDPHSPYKYGLGFWNIFKGMIWAHIGWLFANSFEHEHLIRRLRTDPLLARIDRWFVPCVVAGLVLPPIFGILLRHSFSWMGVDFLWGGLISLFFSYHFTWSVNSICHMWGERPFKTKDHSTNNRIVAYLTCGEGNHNGHHAFPRSAKHGLLGEPDLTWRLIQLLEKHKLVTDVYVPTPEQIAAKLQ